ncbi:MAG: nucleotidyltransferase domain-containing protein [Candidatus Muiribacteriota bacterium]|jgi:predicted nucleotidyltransferase
MAEKINKTIKKIIIEYSKIIKTLIQYENIYLFGSYAKNTANQDSDIDIAIIVDGNKIKNKFFLEYELMTKRRKIDLRIEPHILLKNELTTPFGNNILSKGIKIL